MPRKSARLQSKSTLPGLIAESDEFQPKRRRMSDVEQGNIAVTNRRQQFRIQNNRLPISQTHAITSAMIVPTDEVDALACPESCAGLASAAVGDHWATQDEDDVVHVATNPPRQRQLFRFSNHFQNEFERLLSVNPLPTMDWADSEEVWRAMKFKEEKYVHSMNIFLRHPDVKPNMRAVLLTWLTEVCEVYKLHKETYYLAMDFIDRFLMATNHMKTSQLQLLGVTALFVAAKIEEIYPPKSTEFAYVADGAFEVEDIHEYELMMIKALNWLLAPMTPNAWIQLYLQVAASRAGRQAPSPSTTPSSSCRKSPSSSPCDLNSSANSGVSDLVAYAEVIDLTGSDCATDKSSSFSSSDRFYVGGSERVPLAERRFNGVCDGGVGGHERVAVVTDYETDSADELEEEEKREDLDIVYPLYSPHDYVQVARLLDLVMLDSHSLRFKYSVVAAAAVYHATDVQDICQITCLTWEELEPCVSWMKIHKSIVDRFQPLAAQIRTFENVSESDAHKIQYHSVSKDMWEEAMKCSENFFRQQSNLVLLADVIQREESFSVSPGPSAPNFITPPRSGRKVTPHTSTRQ